MLDSGGEMTVRALEALGTVFLRGLFGCEVAYVGTPFCLDTYVHVPTYVTEYLRRYFPGLDLHTDHL